MTLLMIYKSLRRSIENYAAPIWSTNTSASNIGKILRAQNEVLRIIITGSSTMSSMDHLHSETEMLLVKDHMNCLSAQYLVHCMDTENVCHHITMMEHPPRDMKKIFFTDIVTWGCNFYSIVEVLYIWQQCSFMYKMLLYIIILR